MRHISARLLCCSCTLYKQNGYDEDRQPTFEEAVDLTKVWITSAQAVTNGSVGKQSSDTLSITYDVYSSLPRGITFSKGDKVIYDGLTYYVTSIEPVYVDGLSHYLIGLA